MEMDDYFFYPELCAEAFWGAALVVALDQLLVDDGSRKKINPVIICHSFYVQLGNATYFFLGTGTF